MARSRSTRGWLRAREAGDGYNARRVSLPEPQFKLAVEIGRVRSMRVPLDGAEETRFQRLMEDLVLIDVHQHPMVLADDANEMPAYFRGNSYVWGFEAVKAGGWTAVSPRVQRAGCAG